MLKQKASEQRVLILGTSELAREVIKAIKARPQCGYKIVGIVGEGRNVDIPGFHRPVAGYLDDLHRIIDEYRPDRIIVALAERRQHLLVYHLIEARVHRGILIEDAAEVYERLLGKLSIEAMTPSSVIFSRDFRPSEVSLAVSRSVSLLMAAAGLILFAPLFGLIASAIKLDSRGPVFFGHVRIGKGGKPFKLLKFRTMYPAAGNRSEWARDNGDRITRVGRWLRKFRLDELPQFVNVLRGDMNLVGPRPHPASNFELFLLVSRNAPECGRQIPYYSLRWMVRPGITGWAQVRYRYANDLDEEIEKIRYDLYYIKNFSFWLDLRILLETVKTVLLGRESQAAPEPSAKGMASGLMRFEQELTSASMAPVLPRAVPQGSTRAEAGE